MTLWLLAMLACGGADAPESANEPAPAKAIAPVAPAKALKGAVAAEVKPEEGWGAVFWRSGQAWKNGGGTVVASAIAARAATPSGGPNICGGVALKGAIPNAALALPDGAEVPKIQKTPAIRAHLVERTAWRLDEVLPPRDKYSPAVSSNAPSQQRGVQVGSVAKTRRHGAPPILLSTGVRECTAAIAVVDSKAERTLAYDRIAGICDTLRVLPATQLDGDRQREFAAFNDTNVILYRLNEASNQVKLTRIGHWQCDADASGG
jgi:hypothetical protein